MAASLYAVSCVSCKKTDRWNDCLEGTEFSLYLGDTWLETISIQSSDFHAFQYGCLLGKTYTVKETKVMPGKIKSPDFNVTIDNEANYQPTYWYTVTNKDAPKVQITKKSDAPQDILDLSAYTVSGAEFGVYEDQACTKKIPNGTLTTKENGVTDTLTLPCNTDGTYTYYVKETKAPDGHEISNNTAHPVTVTLPNDAGAVKPVEFTDKAQSTTMSAFAHKLDNKGKPIQDVVFEAKLYDGVYKTVNECLQQTPKKTWYLTSDEKGNVLIDRDYIATDYEKTSDSLYKINGEIRIPIGCTVTMQEVKASSIYVMDDTIQIWETESNKEVELKRHYNDIKPSSIHIKKYDETGVTPLANVEIELKFDKESETANADASVPKSYIPLLTVGDSVTGKTDTNGEIVWDNLDQGEYTITEVKTVEGHSLLKDPIHVTLPIVMTEEEVNASGADKTKGTYDDGYTNKWYFFDARYEITNSAVFKMPTTGADGVWKYIFLGFGTMAVLVTGVIIYDTKNRKKRERHTKR